MFELSYIDRSGAMQRKVVPKFLVASEIAKSTAVRMGATVRIRRITVDILLADAVTQDVFRIAKGVPVKRAARWARDWMADSTEYGCLLWPAKLPVPTTFRRFPNEVHKIS